MFTLALNYRFFFIFFKSGSSYTARTKKTAGGVHLKLSLIYQMKDKGVSAFLCHVVVMLFINSAMLNNAKPATEGKFE